MVNQAYDASVDASPRDQIEEIERRLFALAEQGKDEKGFQEFVRATGAARIEH